MRNRSGGQGKLFCVAFEMVNILSLGNKIVRVLRYEHAF